MKILYGATKQPTTEMFLCVLEIFLIFFILNPISLLLSKSSATLRVQRFTVLTLKVTLITY